MEINALVSLISAVAAAVSMLVTAYLALRRNKPEVKKLELEVDSEVVSAANLNMEGAQKSIGFLMSTVESLKKEIEAERKARQEDAIYFKRRIKEIDKEARDYRLWAARLAKQVIEKGGIPVPFISSTNDSDPLIQTITTEQEQLFLAKEEREKEIRDAASRKPDAKSS